MPTLLSLRHHPNASLPSVAGATYTGWDKLNTAAIKLFVDTFGLGERWGAAGVPHPPWGYRWLGASHMTFVLTTQGSRV